MFYSPIINAQSFVVASGHPLSRAIVNWTASAMHNGKWDQAKLVSLPPVALGKILHRILRHAYGISARRGSPDSNLNWYRYHDHFAAKSWSLCTSSTRGPECLGFRRSIIEAAVDSRVSESRCTNSPLKANNG